MEDQKEISVPNTQETASPNQDALQKQIDALRVMNIQRDLETAKDKFIQTLSNDEKQLVNNIEDVNIMNTVLTQFRALNKANTPANVETPAPAKDTTPKDVETEKVETKKEDEEESNIKFGKTIVGNNNGETWLGLVRKATQVVEKATRNNPQGSMKSDPVAYAEYLEAMEYAKHLYTQQTGKKG